ncbi:hypothetical protein AWN76_014485 [Rhodothermaceae bacterium RA]|nr:hypothetical protein AWN76_014485 [Rhodothermaceae bacterium RA]
MTNDPKDRHVLAAAVHARVNVILTFNLKDFPREDLQPWNIEAKHPDDYVLTLYDIDESQVVSRIAAIAEQRQKPLEDVLINLGNSLRRFASRLYADLGLP